MIENRRYFNLFCHAMLILGIAVIAFPIYVTLVASTLDVEQARQVPLPLVPSGHFFENIKAIFSDGMIFSSGFSRLLFNSLMMALLIAVGKIAISLLSAFAFVYFRFPGRMLCFWTIFLTLMLPVEVRIMPTFKVVADLGLLNSYAGLTLPLIASATATFLFRQFFLSVPHEMLEASRIDGAGPMRFFKDILLPLSKNQIVALFIIMFIYGWNQYLWPLLITTDETMYTAIIGIRKMVSASGDVSVAWNLVMANVIFTMLPPLLIVIIMQRHFVKGLVDSEK